jgi:DNA-binding transcriptional regulator YiaG
VTQLEVRALLARVDARKLREDAGIRQVTVARAFGVQRHYINWWETGKVQPVSPAAHRWIRFVAALERRAEVTAELERAA